MRIRRLLVLAMALHFAVGTIAWACPGCKYSPSGWGFCRYDFYAGPYECRTIVVDPWTGRTDCDVCGFCHWGAPHENQACDLGGDPNDPLHRSPNPGVNQGLVWVGAPVGQVAIF